MDELKPSKQAFCEKCQSNLNHAEKRIMKTEFVEQYGHTWRVFERLVKGFDQDAWIRAGRGTTTPARIAFHILQAVRYYLEDSATVLFASGKSFEGDSWAIVEEDLPSQNDILVCIGEFKVKTEKWLSKMDFGSKNESFEWAGETRLGVALFLLRHSIYHMGELSSLLNESKKGNAEDNYVKAI